MSDLQRFAALVSLLGTTSGSAAATEAPSPLPVPPVRELFARPALAGDRPSEARPSPDGRWVAFVWSASGERSPRNLWLVEARPGATPRNLTRFADAPADAAPSFRPWKAKKGGEPPRRLAQSPAWSPRSDFVVLVAAGDLYLAPIGPDAPLRRLTDTVAVESQPAVAPDGRSVVYQSGGDLFRLALDGPGLTQLTAHEEGQAYAQPVWSPAGDRLVAVRRNEKERFDLLVPDYLGEKVEAGKIRGGRADEEAVLIAAAGGAAVRLDLGSDGPSDLRGLRFSADGHQLVVDGLSRDYRTRSLHLVSLAGPTPSVRRLVAESDPAWVYSNDWLFAPELPTAFSPDGSRILFVSERSGFAQPWLVATAGGEPRPVSASPARFETSWAAWASDGELVLLDGRSARNERRLYRHRLGQPTALPLGDLPGLSVEPVLSTDGSLLVFSRSRFDQPGDLYAVRLPEGTPFRLTDSVPERFRRIPWAVPRPVTLRSGDGTPLAAMVVEPAGPVPRGGRPAVIFAHGAGYLQNVVDGWTIYSPNFMFHSRLVARGYVVLEVDYRGSAGYGRDFRVAVHHHLGGKDLEDVAAGARWLRARGDIGKIGIYGGSYGGFLALMALFRLPAEFDAGAALRFVADWENYYRGNPAYCLPRLGSPEAEPEAYRQSSPIHFAAGLRAPLLLLHGVKDDNVHFQDAVQLTDRLIALGKPFELMIYPREGHGFEAPESWIDEYERIERFFDRHLAGRP